jgi:hypothetical protein
MNISFLRSQTSSGAPRSAELAGYSKRIILYGPEETHSTGVAMGPSEPIGYRTKVFMKAAKKLETRLKNRRISPSPI